MITIPNISRYKAAAIHLTFSVLIAATSLIIMLGLWYPPPLFSAMGGQDLIVLIVGIDVCLGPLITLIIFDTKKKKLALDLAIVVVVQLAALSYGVYAMQAGRPVFIEYTSDKFVVISAANMDSKSMAEAPPEFRILSLTGPKFVSVVVPSGKKELEDFVHTALSGSGVQKYYRDYDSHAQQAITSEKSLDKLNNLTADDATTLQKAIDKSGKNRDKLRFLPVVASHHSFIALLDAGTGHIVDLIDINPDN